MDKRLYNVSLLGLAFMFLFTAYQTMGNIEVNILLTFFSYILYSFDCLGHYYNITVVNTGHGFRYQHTNCGYQFVWVARPIKGDIRISNTNISPHDIFST